MGFSSLRLQQILLSFTLLWVSLTLGGDRALGARLMSWYATQSAAAFQPRFNLTYFGGGDRPKSQATGSDSGREMEFASSRLLSERPTSKSLADAVEAARPTVVRIALDGVPGTAAESGSGVIIDAQGLILTNAHVVRNGTSVTVTLWDETELQGRVLGKDDRLDLAIVQIEADDLHALPTADSEQIRPGEWAIAIGSPFGLDHTATIGIISAVGRSSADARTYSHQGPFIQTDAAINPGNSGGPLLNEQGKLIGINTAVLGGTQGIGFAIPIHLAQDWIDQVMTEVHSSESDPPELSRQPPPGDRQTQAPSVSEPGQSGFSFDQSLTDAPRLGIYAAFPPEAIAAADAAQDDPEILENPTWGVQVVRVLPDSPASRVGLRGGDVIMAIDGTRVTTPNDLRQRVSRATLNAPISLDIRRNRQILTLTPSLVPRVSSRLQQ